MEDVTKEKDLIIDYIEKMIRIDSSYINYLNDTFCSPIILGGNYIRFYNKEKFFTQKINIDEFLEYRRFYKLNKIKQCLKGMTM